MLLSPGPSLLPCSPILHRAVKETILKRAGIGEGTLQSPRAFRPGLLRQCRREGGSSPPLSDPATSWKEAEVSPSPPHSTRRLVQASAGMGVPKVTIASGPAIPALSLTWSFKAGARLALSPIFFPVFPTNLWGYGELDITRSTRKSQVAGAALESCPSKAEGMAFLPPEDL